MTCIIVLLNSRVFVLVPIPDAVAGEKANTAIRREENTFQESVQAI